MTTNELVERIELLERRIARQRWVHALVLLVVTTSIGVGAKMQDSKPAIVDVVRTRKLEVVDGGGKARVVVESDAGITSLRFIDKTMGESILLKAEEGKNNSIVVWGVNSGLSGNFRVVVGDSVISSSMQSASAFSPSVFMAVEKDGGYFAQFGRQRDKLSVATFPKQDDPEFDKLAERFRLDYAERQAAAAKSLDSSVIISSSANGGEVLIHNKTGEATSTLRVDEYGNGVIGVWDRKGTGRTLTPRD